ncbi:MAG TPA: hypothetical protein ENN56_04805 [Firmicutes bacterium]|nr:hypothetical protein [Bacillota bacterium]
MRAIIRQNGAPVFPLGMYEFPRDESEWKTWTDAGINLVRCGNREQLDIAHKYGVSVWVPVPMIVVDDASERRLIEMIETLVGHPALAVWEVPDEAIWRTICFGDDRARRLWEEPEDRVVEVVRRRDELVKGLARGAKIIGERDPGRPIWLNEATPSDQDTLARCLPWLDIVGFDFYPVPPSIERPMHEWGPLLDKYRRTAPRHELWAVQQAFSWSSLPRHGAGKPPSYPNTDQVRFAAWQAIAHGATGLLWWGSSHEDRPAPFLADLMETVQELKKVQPFLTAANIPSVRISANQRLRPSVLGVSGFVRLIEDADGRKRRMLALVNEDPWGHDVELTGLHDIGIPDPNEMRPVTPVSACPFVRLTDNWTVSLEGYEVRVYVTP